MAKDTTTDRKGHPQTTVELESGEQVWLCRCFESKKFPYCDGTHRQHPGKGPVQVKAPSAESGG